MPYEPFKSLRLIVKSTRSGEPLSRRELLAGGAEALVLGLAYASGACAGNYVPFSDAKKDYRLRQKYVDQAVRENPPPAKLDSAVYRHGIARYPNALFPEVGMLMRTEFSIAPLSSGAETVELQVFRDAFDDLVNEDEFLSTMVDHEYEHLRLLKLGIELTGPVEALPEIQPRIFTPGGDLAEPFMELDAFSKQIKAFPKRSGITGPFKDDIFYSYKLYRELVRRKEKTPLTAWLLERYSESP